MNEDEVFAVAKKMQSGDSVFVSWSQYQNFTYTFNRMFSDYCRDQNIYATFSIGRDGFILVKDAETQVALEEALNVLETEDMIDEMNPGDSALLEPQNLKDMVDLGDSTYHTYRNNLYTNRGVQLDYLVGIKLYRMIKAPSVQGVK